MSTITITTDQELTDYLDENDNPFFFATDRTGFGHVVYSNEDGDYYATRPPLEDDVRPDGTCPDGVTFHVDGLELPITIQTPAALDRGTA